MTINGPLADAGVGPCRVAPAGLARESGLPLLAGDGRLLDPLLVVDLDQPCDEVDAAVAAARASDRLLVGVSPRGRLVPALEPLVRELGTTLVPAGREGTDPALVGVPDVARAEAAIRATVRAAPQAATVLGRLLRWTGALTVPQAIEAESLAYSTLLGGAEFARWLRACGPRPQPAGATGEPVALAREAGELRLRLNRPDRRNAYGRELRDALVAALEVAERDPSVRRVVLDGAGPSFCSGGDLDEFGTAPDLATAHFVRTRGGAALPLFRLADRVEVHLHGACIGAGIELSAFAGRVVAVGDTRIRLPEVGMGLIPGAGGTVSIPRRIGRWRTFYLAVVGDYVDAATALAWGLVDELGGTGSEEERRGS